MPIGEIELLVVPNLAKSLLPGEPVELISSINIDELADPRFSVPAPVDILLGAGVFGSTAVAYSIAQASFAACATKENELTFLVQRFWELDEIPTR